MSPAGAGRAYCRGSLKRSLDLCLSLIALLALLPFLLVLALLVVALSGRPVLFVQERVGMDGRPFWLLKFRTMRPGARPGLPITGRGDPRITRVGRFLRASKLDELPQLINVLMGDMSLVGPRPEIPRYVNRYSPEHRRVLEVRPGLTDPATVLFRDEESLLGAVAEDRRERMYVEEILPRKLEMNLRYVQHAGLRYDLTLLLKTFATLLFVPKA